MSKSKIRWDFLEELISRGQPSSYRSMSALTGVRHQTIASMFQGLCNPQLDTLASIAPATGFKRWELLRIADEGFTDEDLERIEEHRSAK